MQIFILTWLFAFLIVLINTKTDIHEYLNSYHSVFLDIFFTVANRVQLGPFVEAVATLKYINVAREWA